MESSLRDPTTKNHFLVVGFANPSKFGSRMVVGLRGERVEWLCP